MIYVAFYVTTSILGTLIHKSFFHYVLKLDLSYHVKVVHSTLAETKIKISKYLKLLRPINIYKQTERTINITSIEKL